jgi:tRNA (adenine37-N6)-methyltransferase
MTETTPSTAFTLTPIGRVRLDGDRPRLLIDPAFRDALLGIEGFSHIYIFFWFHENDHPEGRAVLRVHPRRDPENPLTGVFATHSPNRPNLIGLTRCRIVSVADGVITVDAIDARDHSPIIDIKCYIPPELDPANVRVPEWVGRNRSSSQAR